MPIDSDNNFRRLLRFFVRSDDYGFVFAIADDFSVRNLINSQLIKLAQINGKTIQLFSYNPNEDFDFWTQLKTKANQTDGLIITSISPYSSDNNEKNIEFIQGINFLRESFHELYIPILFWLSSQDASWLVRYAHDLYTQRTGMLLDFREHSVADKLPSTDNVFVELIRNQPIQKASKTKMKLLEQQLEEAQRLQLPQSVIAEQYALPLAKIYASMSLSEKAKDLFHEYLPYFPTNKSAILMELAKTGEILGDADFAEKYYRKALQLIESNKEHLSPIDKATFYRKLGSYFAQKGESKKAFNLLKNAESLLDELLKLNPGNNLYKKELAIVYGKLGDVHLEQGDIKQALAYFFKDARISESLVQHNPQNAEYQKGLAISYSKLGNIYHRKGDYQAALEFFRKDLKVMEELVALNPHHADYRTGLAIAYEKMGDIYQEKGDSQAALEYYKKYLEIMEELVDLNPHHADYKNGLAIAWYKLAGLSPPKQALAYYRQAEQAWQELYELTGYPVYERYLAVVKMLIDELGG